jgi:hypothetical protein
MAFEYLCKRLNILYAIFRSAKSVPYWTLVAS